MALPPRLLFAPSTLVSFSLHVGLGLMLYSGARASVATKAPATATEWQVSLEPLESVAAEPDVVTPDRRVTALASPLAATANGRPRTLAQPRETRTKRPAKESPARAAAPTIAAAAIALRPSARLESPASMPAAERDASPPPRVESASPSASPAVTSGLAARPVHDEGDLAEPPRLLGQSRPEYPALALRRGLEADVVLSLIVEPTGRVSEARVLRARGHGFDAAALAAATELRFAPGRQQGAAVRVRVKWTCRFRLRA